MSWYDNEWGYASQMVREAAAVASAGASGSHSPGLAVVTRNAAPNERHDKRGEEKDTWRHQNLASP